MGFPTPQDAEAAFYEAFQRRDIEAMMAVWSDDDSVECIHPMGPRLRGSREVRESWERIFADPLQLTFRLRDPRYLQSPLLAVHSVYEDIASEADPSSPGTVLATNIYQCGKDGWSLVLHHASPQPRPKAPPAPAPEGSILH